MRISTSLIYQRGVEAMNKKTAELVATQQRVSTGQRLLSPAEDPVGTAQGLGVASAQAQVTQQATNISVAQEAIGGDEGVLQQVTDVLQQIRTAAVTAGSGSLAASDRAAIATELEGRFQQLLGLANSRGADGNYLFSGYAVDTQPFSATNTGANYAGNQGQRLVAVGAGREMPISVDGYTVFASARNGNGTFQTAPGAANAGSGVIDAGSVTSPAALNGHRYQILFKTGTTYDVVDLDAGPAPVMPTDRQYVAGEAVALPGMQVTITGTPTAGDTFDVKPSTEQSVFKTVRSLIATLRGETTTPAGKAQLAYGIGRALTDLDQSLETVLTVRADMGARLQELDSLTSGNSALALQYDTTLSRIYDVDYTKALSDFAQQQVALQAAQKSFVSINQLSLFNYL